MPLTSKEERREYNRRYREKNRDRFREWNAKWRRDNREAIRAFNLRRTGFTPELVKAALFGQGYRCAICKPDLQTVPSKQVHADHCHETGMARGVLCHHCNAGLGCFGDDPERLQQAIEYLRNPPLSLV